MTAAGRAEVESQMMQLQETLPTPLENMPGLTPSLIQKLEAAGVTTVEQLANFSPEELQNIPGIGGKTIEKRDFVEQHGEIRCKFRHGAFCLAGRSVE